MASFLTLFSRYLSKKNKYSEKEKKKADKQAKEKVAKFETQKPEHAKTLKAWEKTYGENKQKADERFSNERKRRVLTARAMGPKERSKTYRSATQYMAKDPFATPPVKKSYAKLTSRKKKNKEKIIRNMNRPNTVKEESAVNWFRAKNKKQK